MVFVTLIKAILVRVVFFIHCFVATWRVVITYGNINYWWILGLLLGLTIETFITLRKRMGEEWKLFSPSIFVYLVAALPSIWLLELHLINLRHQEESAAPVNNATNTESSDILLGISVPAIFDEFGWALAIEQSMFSILIIGRWALPRGDVSRDQLSQILLVHVGMAADMMELFEVFEEAKIVQTPYLIYPLLSLWTISLLQYCLVITTTKARKIRFGGLEDIGSQEDSVECCMRDCNADVIGILITIFMQDLPFLIFRLYLLSAVGIISHMMIFFTCKNTLVILLQLYRLSIIFLATRVRSDDRGGIPAEENSAPVQVTDDRTSGASRLGRNKVLPMLRKRNSQLTDGSARSQGDVRGNASRMEENEQQTSSSRAWHEDESRGNVNNNPSSEQASSNK